MLRQLHSIVMAVDDFEVSRAFYTDALALEQVGSDENSIRVKIGPTTLELRADEPDAGSVDQPSVDHFAFNVDNIDQVVTAVRAAGFTVLSDPLTVTAGPNAGARVVYTHDPDGVTLEFIQPPQR